MPLNKVNGRKLVHLFSNHKSLIIMKSSIALQIIINTICDRSIYSRGEHWYRSGIVYFDADNNPIAADFDGWVNQKGGASQPCVLRHYLDGTKRTEDLPDGTPYTKLLKGKIVEEGTLEQKWYWTTNVFITRENCYIADTVTEIKAQFDKDAERHSQRLGKNENLVKYFVKHLGAKQTQFMIPKSQ